MQFRKASISKLDRMKMGKNESGWTLSFWCYCIVHLQFTIAESTISFFYSSFWKKLKICFQVTKIAWNCYLLTYKKEKSIFAFKIALTSRKKVQIFLTNQTMNYLWLLHFFEGQHILTKYLWREIKWLQLHLCKNDIISVKQPHHLTKNSILCINEASVKCKIISNFKAFSCDGTILYKNFYFLHYMVYKILLKNRQSYVQLCTRNGFVNNFQYFPVFCKLFACRNCIATTFIKDSHTLWYGLVFLALIFTLFFWLSCITSASNF